MNWVGGRGWGGCGVDCESVISSMYIIFQQSQHNGSARFVLAHQSTSTKIMGKTNRKQKSVDSRELLPSTPWRQTTVRRGLRSLESAILCVDSKASSFTCTGTCRIQ